MQTQVLNLSGEVVEEITLPAVFETDYRPDIIKRAVVASQCNRIQPYGPNKYSGMKTSAVGWGSGRAVAKVPRITNGSRAARVPHVRGGRRAHPPKVDTDYSEKVNRKERRLATNSAIAATADADMVANRGHKFSANLPLVASDELNGLLRTKDVIEFLKAVNVYDDVIRAKNGRTIRAGRGKLRGRKYKTRKSILIVADIADGNIAKAARNLPGVDVATADSLNAEILAPGTHAGRLTVWTKSAIVRLGERA